MNISEVNRTVTVAKKTIKANELSKISEKDSKNETAEIDIKSGKSEFFTSAKLVANNEK